MEVEGMNKPKNFIYAKGKTLKRFKELQKRFEYKTANGFLNLLLLNFEETDKIAKNLRFRK